LNEKINVLEEEIMRKNKRPASESQLAGSVKTYPIRSGSLAQEATINGQWHSSHPAGIVAGQEYCNAGNIFCFAHTAKDVGLVYLLACSWIVLYILGHGCLED
jgi:hypothetical protein